MTLPCICCAPCAEAYEQRRREEEQAARHQRLAGIIPPEFLKWEEQKGNGHALGLALAALTFSPRRGVALHGLTGTCKTRIIWRVVQHIIEKTERDSWLVVDAFDLASKDIAADAFSRDWLFIDDLGNEPMKPGYEAGLLRLLRHRNNWHLPTSITTQFTPKTLRGRFSNGAAADAILRRLMERATAVNTDPQNAPPAEPSYG